MWGGLCPGLNNVIRDIVITAMRVYGVRRVLGFLYGYRGLVEKESHIELTPEGVSEIHELGGTILGSSRGPQDPCKMVDRLEELDVNVLFVIGGDGTMTGALALSDEIRRRNLEIAVVGIPKTIDNDFKFMDQSFGFVTAYSKALRKRLERRDHAVIVIAEGAGQNLFGDTGSQRDPSGNIVLGDIGVLLSQRIKEKFKDIDMEINLRYIDPSYIIRSIKASPPDSVLCTSFAIHAVHAAMCGKTEMIIALWHRALVHIPMRQAILERNVVDPSGTYWLSVLSTTGQPLAFY